MSFCNMMTALKNVCQNIIRKQRDKKLVKYKTILQKETFFSGSKEVVPPPPFIPIISAFYRVTSRHYLVITLACGPDITNFN